MLTPLCSFGLVVFPPHMLHALGHSCCTKTVWGVVVSHTQSDGFVGAQLAPRAQCDIGGCQLSMVPHAEHFASGCTGLPGSVAMVSLFGGSSTSAAAAQSPVSLPVGQLTGFCVAAADAELPPPPPTVPQPSPVSLPVGQLTGNGGGTAEEEDVEPSKLMPAFSSALDHLPIMH
jgi:hypothetical protein